MEVDRFRGQFLRPVLLQDQMAEVMDIAEVVAVQSLLVRDVADQCLLR